MPARQRTATAEARSSTTGTLAVGALVLFGFAALAAAYAVVQPIGQPSDETAHIEYARALSEHGALPGAEMAERQQPPLYYLIAALLLRSGVSDQGLRALGVVCGVAFVVITMVVAARLLPGRPGTAVLAGAIVAALPGAQSVAGSVSDDPLAWVVGASIVLIIVDTLREPSPTLRLVVLQGIVIAAALLTKETDWPLIPVLLAVIAFQWGRRLRMTDLAALLGLPALLVGWWFVRNVVTLGALAPPLGPLNSQVQAEHLLRSTGQLKVAAGGLARSLFGPETGPTGALVRTPWALVLIVVVIAGGCLFGVAGVREVAQRWPVLDAPTRRIVLALLACGVAAVVGWVASSVLVDLQPRARYLLVVAPAGAALLAAAAAHLAASRPRLTMPAAVTIAAALIAVNADALRVAAHA